MYKCSCIFWNKSKSEDVANPDKAGRNERRNMNQQARRAANKDLVSHPVVVLSSSSPVSASSM